MKCELPVTELKGIGPKTAEKLSDQNIQCIRDLLLCFPVSYCSIKNITPIVNAIENQYGYFKLKIKSKPFFINKSSAKSVFSVSAGDETGTVKIVFFNQSYIASMLKLGQEFIFYGKIKLYNGKITVDNPKIFQLEQENTILPIYPLAHVKQKIIRQAVSCALESFADMPELFSEAFLNENGLLYLKRELTGIHLPLTESDYIDAGKSYLFKQFLLYNSILDNNSNKNAPEMDCISDIISEFKSFFSYEFTGAQLRAIKDIFSDMQKSVPMNRLIQGDVGCGKTNVAFFGAYYAYKCGYQTVIMAPTEMLAYQHYKNAENIFKEKAVFLSSAVVGKEKKSVLNKIESGEAKLIIATHSILYADVVFKNPALIIIDEQHRFGVKQRAALSKIGSGVHKIVMSATPIPRTLTLAMYGTVNVTEIDELPPGRKTVLTYLIGNRKRKDMYNWIFEMIKKGGQAYVVCPYIDHIDESDDPSVEELYSELTKSYPLFSIEKLTGRLNAEEKEKILRDFLLGSIKLLISTTVIEVGIDVKNASIMVIEGAERFGLATLHQLRGRVGRGNEQAYCFMLPYGSENNKRLEKMTKTNNGFEIAEFDLATRGGGQLKGFKQHGELEAEAVSITENPELFLKAAVTYKIMKKKYPSDYSALKKAAEIKTMESEISDIADN